MLQMAPAWMRDMTSQMDTFLKNLEKLRELDQQGQNPDPKKFDTMAKSLLWDVKRTNPLNIPSEYLELFKIMATSEAAGDYWKGYGAAITDFLLPLIRTSDLPLVLQEGEKGSKESKPAGSTESNTGSQNSTDGFQMIMD